MESWSEVEEIPDEREYRVSEHMSPFKTNKSKMKERRFNLPYDYLYIFVKQKTPKLLELSEIDPYHNSAKYLNNLHHKNIYVFGADIFPTTHSFAAINYQAHIICANLLHLIASGK